MRNLIKTLVLMLMLSFSHAAIAGDLEDGLTAEQKNVVATALRLWTPLAEQGDASAQYALGIAYDQGLGVAQDYKTAVKWYTLAAEQGYADAQYNLGNMYSKGLRVAHDYKTAIKWYTLSAEQGHAKAQLMLGFGYALGQGVAQDFVKAHMWFNIAEIDETSGAIKNRDIVAKKMTPAQIAEAQKAASLCIKQNFKNCD
jgi:TPR repeat protein